MNTRINPTVNGLPHLGHAVIGLVNQFHAKSTGGHITFIADDNQPAWLKLLGWQQMNEYAAQWIDDLAWLGIEFNRIVYQSSLEESIVDLAKHEGYMPQAEYPLVAHVASDKLDYYPFDNFLTFEKVYIDSLCYIDLLIRGIDLLPEFSLYNHFWTMWLKRPPPEHVYLPRLQYQNGEQIDNVSKTNQTHKIRTYRERGIKPGDVLWMLRRSCMIDVYGDWDWHNIAPRPILLPMLESHEDKRETVYAVNHPEWVRG